FNYLLTPVSVDGTLTFITNTIVNLEGFNPTLAGPYIPGIGYVAPSDGVYHFRAGMSSITSTEDEFTQTIINPYFNIIPLLERSTGSAIENFGIPMNVGPL
ncbi:MAG: hypothetical protein O7C59_08005, partial [Rickettsia endosymbiont of Ixodes persulcatus]|nr:hypothetical protein [Rickettsia endosymbiont of Ixodes persulcatus]